MSRRLLSAAVLVVALACGACGGNDATQATPPASAATTSPSPSGGPSLSGGSSDGSDFCAAARRIGLDDAQIVDSGNPDAGQLLAGLDHLDALAPPDLEADFDRFTGIEHSLLDPGSAPNGAAADINSPKTLSALGHVETYLQQTCGLSH
jgi:hypothetical protein